MLYFGSSKRPTAVWLAMTRPEFSAVNVATGELSDSLATMFEEGALFVFPNLVESLDDIAMDMAAFGALTLYGESMAAGHWHIGKRGVRLAGLQGYQLAVGSLSDMVDFWRVLEDACIIVGTLPAATPGSTAMRIAQALSPERFVSPGGHVRDWARHSFSAGARHAKPGKYPSAFLYDIHSAYPTAMLEELPFGIWVSRPRREYPFYIARVNIDYESHSEFSALWVRGQDGLVYHPVKARRLECVLNSIDIATLEKHGRLRINKMTSQIGFRTLPLLRPAQEYLANLQVDYPKYRRQFKIMRNAIFGKFVQGDSHERYVLKPIKDKAAAIKSGQLYRQYNGFEYGLFRYTDEQVSFSHSAIASAITAMTRDLVYNAVDKDSVAVRTDSILSEKERRDLNLGTADGCWDLEDKGRATVFGRSGFIVHGKPHLDGVQIVKHDRMGFLAEARYRDRFGFESNEEVARAWNLKIETHETVIAKGGRLEIYHSPLAKVVKAVIPPEF